MALTRREFIESGVGTASVLGFTLLLYRPDPEEPQIRLPA